jgi:D-alanyl-D-alanine carboxypeptidase
LLGQNAGLLSLGVCGLTFPVKVRILAARGIRGLAEKGRVLAKDGRIALTAALAAWALCVQPAAAGTAMVFDFEDGHVLYAEDLDAPWYPASLTKMMTAYLVFTAIRDKRATKETKVFISPTANKQPPTRLGLKVGKDISLGQALQALIMRSANDVAVAISETLGGDEAAFVKQMNQTAARLGMAHTHFINPHGLPAEQQVTTARDMGLLAQALLRDFPEEAALYAQTQATIHKINIGTHNALLTSFPGGDGIKTGYTCASGYNLVASATRNGRKLIAVLLGETGSSARTARAAALLESGFRTREWKSAFPIARVENYPSQVVGAGFEPDAEMVERFRACKAPPPPPPNVSANAGTAAPGAAASSQVKKVSASKSGKKTVKKKKRRPPID